MAKRILAGLLLVFIACAAQAAPAAAAAREIPRGYQVLRSTSGSFMIFYPPRLAKMAAEIETLLEESAGGIAGELGLEKISAIKVILASDSRTYKLLHQGKVPEWGIAFSDVGEQVLGVNVDAVLRNPRPLAAVVRHELSHLLLAQRVGGVPVPTWFMEGLAIRQAGEWSLSDEWRLMTMVGRRDLPYLEELRGSFPRAEDVAALSYGISHVAVEELFRDRPDALMTLTAFTRDTGDFERAFASTFGMSTYDFAGRLYVEIDRRYKVPGTILNASPYWLGATLFFVMVYVVKRARNRRRLEAWEEEEARESRIWY